MIEFLEQPSLIRTIKEFPNIEAANSLLMTRSGIVINTLQTASGEPLYEYNCNRVHAATRNNVEANMFLVNGEGDLVSRNFTRIPVYKELAPFTNHELNWSDTYAEQKVHGVPVTFSTYKDELIINSKRDYVGEPLVEPEVIRTFLSKRMRGKSINEIFTGDKYCWIFEYTSPTLSCISEHLEEDLVLLGGFHRKNFGELKPSIIDSFASVNGFSRPWRKKVDGEAYVLNILRELTPLDEGLVVRDCINHRIIFRNDSFRIARKILESTPGIGTAYHAADLFRSNYDSLEFMCSQYERFEDIFRSMYTTLDGVVNEIEKEWDGVCDIEDQKEFADGVASCKHRTILFGIRNGKIKTQADILKNISSSSFVEF